MATPIRDALSSAAWFDLVDWLPRNLEVLAASSAGFRRRRAIRSPLDFLRLALAYGVMDLSLRSVSAWCAEQGLGELSDVAVLGRLRRGWPFLEAVLRELLSLHVTPIPGSASARRLRLADATTLSAPGSEGAD
jgi:hypothetical protein